MSTAAFSLGLSARAATCSLSSRWRLVSIATKTRAGLAGLHLSKGALKDQTVAQVLTLANGVLGGAGPPPTGMSVADLSDIVASINANYDSGKDDNGYLVP